MKTLLISLWCDRFYNNSCLKYRQASSVWFLTIMRSSYLHMKKKTTSYVYATNYYVYRYMERGSQSHPCWLTVAWSFKLFTCPGVTSLPLSLSLLCFSLFFQFTYISIKRLGAVSSPGCELRFPSVSRNTRGTLMFILRLASQIERL